MRPTDIGAEINVSRGIPPTNSTGATINGTGIDRMAAESEQGFLSGVLHVACGSASGTPTSFTVDGKLQDSADNSTFADISPAVSVTQMTAAGEQDVKFNAKGLRRYVRAVVTTAFVGGTTPAIPVAAAVVLGGATLKPTTL